MKNFFKKNKKVVVSLVILSLILVAALVATKSRQIFSPNASVDGKLIIRGAVSIYDSNDIGANRFTARNCPSKPFKSAPEMKVSISPSKGFVTAWDCGDPNFVIIGRQGQGGLATSEYTITLTPPAGYNCVHGYFVGNGRYDEPDESDENCSVKYKVGSSSPFLWFKVAKN